jgi:hypothetical protein
MQLLQQNKFRTSSRHERLRGGHSLCYEFQFLPRGFPGFFFTGLLNGRPRSPSRTSGAPRTSGRAVCAIKGLRVARPRAGRLLKVFAHHRDKNSVCARQKCRPRSPWWRAPARCLENSVCAACVSARCGRRPACAFPLRKSGCAGPHALRGLVVCDRPRAGSTPLSPLRLSVFAPWLPAGFAFARSSPCQLCVIELLLSVSVYSIFLPTATRHANH